MAWKLDRLGRDLRHLVNLVHELTSRGVGLRILTGQGASIDTTTAAGKLVFGIFAALAELTLISSAIRCCQCATRVLRFEVDRCAKNSNYRVYIGPAFASL